MYFSTRLYRLDLYFSIDNVKLKTADAHKHIGVTFSAACKWSKHINNVVVKQANNYDLRNANNFTIPRCCLTLFKDSFFQPLFISGIIYPNISEIHLATAFQNLDQRPSKTSKICFVWFTSGQYSTYMSKAKL